MPAKSPVIFPAEQRMLAELGERIRLARLRRQLSMEVIAGRTGFSRTTVHHVEKGDAACTLGTYLRVLAALGLEADFNALAADDKVGRRLQDLGLTPPRRARPRA